MAATMEMEKLRPEQAEVRVEAQKGRFGCHACRLRSIMAQYSEGGFVHNGAFKYHFKATNE